MRLDLMILPQYNQNANFARDLINLERESTLFELISKVEDEKGREISKRGIYSYTGKTNIYEGTCYGATVETPYGDIIKGVFACDLKNILANYKSYSWINKAFIAYLNELPNDFELWLYWH